MLCLANFSCLVKIIIPQMLAQCWSILCKSNKSIIILTYFEIAICCPSWYQTMLYIFIN
jgi:hypothetical protein